MTTLIDTSKIKNSIHWTIASLCNDINAKHPGTCDFQYGNETDNETDNDLKAFGIGDFSWFSLKIRGASGNTIEYNCGEDDNKALRILDKVRAIAAYLDVEESADKIDFCW